MTPSAFLLTAVGVLWLIVGLPGLFEPKAFSKAAKSFAGDKNIVRVSSLFMFLVAFIFLSIEWDLNAHGWNVLIPILGWLTLFKGLVWFWSPGWVKKVWSNFLKNDNVVVFGALLITALGVGAIYVAMNFL